MVFQNHMKGATGVYVPLNMHGAAFANNAATHKLMNSSHPLCSGSMRQ